MKVLTLEQVKTQTLENSGKKSIDMVNRNISVKLIITIERFSNRETIACEEKPTIFRLLPILRRGYS